MAKWGNTKTYLQVIFEGQRREKKPFVGIIGNISGCNDEWKWDLRTCFDCGDGIGGAEFIGQGESSTIEQAKIDCEQAYNFYKMGEPERKRKADEKYREERLTRRWGLYRKRSLFGLGYDEDAIIHAHDHFKSSNKTLCGIAITGGIILPRPMIQTGIGGISKITCSECYQKALEIEMKER